MQSRERKVFDGDVGFEIKGYAEPQFRRKPLAQNEDDIDIDIPNGDLNHGRQYYSHYCGGCHDLDGDQFLGPALRNVYLRKNGRNKKFQLYGANMKSRTIVWNRRKLWEFLQNPEKMFADTNMSFEGVTDPFSLASVIDYLQYLRVFTCDSRSDKVVI